MPVGQHRHEHPCTDNLVWGRSFTPKCRYHLGLPKLLTSPSHYQHSKWCLCPDTAYFHLETFRYIRQFNNWSLLAPCFIHSDRKLLQQYNERDKTRDINVREGCQRLIRLHLHFPGKAYAHHPRTSVRPFPSRFILDFVAITRHSCVLYLPRASPKNQERHRIKESGGASASISVPSAVESGWAETAGRTLPRCARPATSKFTPTYRLASLVKSCVPSIRNWRFAAVIIVVTAAVFVVVVVVAVNADGDPYIDAIGDNKTNEK